MKRSIPMLFLLVGLLALLGCSKSSTTSPSTNLNAAQEQSFGSQAAGFGVVATGMVSSFSGGLDGFVPSPPSGFSQPHQGSPVLGNPPSGWTKGQNPHQLGDTTWYWASWVDTIQVTFHDTIYVKFTPDIWGNGQPPVTRVDLEFLLYTLSSGTKTNLDEAVWAKYSNNWPDTSMTNGGVKITGSSTYNNTTSNFTYQFTWTNCTRTGWQRPPPNHTCSGTFSWSATSSYLTQNYNLAGSYTFTGGSGTGVAQYSNVTFAKFVFNSDGTAYYTLLSEGWNTQHPFTW